MILQEVIDGLLKHSDSTCKLYNPQCLSPELLDSLLPLLTELENKREADRLRQKLAREHIRVVDGEWRKEWKEYWRGMGDALRNVENWLQTPEDIPVRLQKLQKAEEEERRIEQCWKDYPHCPNCGSHLNQNELEREACYQCGCRFDLHMRYRLDKREVMPSMIEERLPGNSGEGEEGKPTTLEEAAYRVAHEMLTNATDLDPEICKMVSEEFWNLLSD